MLQYERNENIALAMPFERQRRSRTSSLDRNPEDRLSISVPLCAATPHRLDPLAGGARFQLNPRPPA